VAAGATLVGPVVLGEGCLVESDAVVSRTVAWNRCTVGAKAVVDECVLADEAAVGPREALGGEVRLPRRRSEVGGWGVWSASLRALSFQGALPRP
jgi:NDP-sugar pyrophosphorylase family protein